MNIEANQWLTLSRANLIHNLSSVRALVGNARIPSNDPPTPAKYAGQVALGGGGRTVVAVVKANAYGAGAVGIARELSAHGVDAFAVATVSEGVELRAHGIRGVILCLTYFMPHEVAAIFAHDLTPTVFTTEAVRLLATEAHRQERLLDVWVKVDTGLSRLGVPHARAVEFIRQVSAEKWLNVAGVFSTVTENPARDDAQVERLRAVREQLASRDVPFSIASSHAILSSPHSYLDAVRPGIMLLGFEPSERERMDMRLVRQADLQPIVTWQTRVGYVKVVAAGEQVGYGVRSTLTRDTPIATLTIGWADGYPPRASESGHVLARGRCCPVLAVSANSTLVDVSDVPDVAIGEEVTLLGAQGNTTITPYELAQATGSVYRLLTGIPREMPRVWT
ncbi:MAG: alanine racemase [Chloroflexota bacterium]